MRNTKRLLALLLTAIMIIGAAATVFAANLTFTDVDDHWAWKDGYIPYLVEKDVLNGYKISENNYIFKPDGEVKRSEFIKMLDETFGLTETKAVSFSDVKSTDWFCVYFQKAAAQGYLLNYGTSCNPEGKITREEAISLLVRYLDLDPEQKADADTFSDYNTIDDKYKDYVLEAIEAKLIEGYKQSNGTYLFKPLNTLTRAEALTILYRAAGCIYNKTSYARDAGAAATNSVITKGNVTLSGQTLSGRTIISEGAADGLVVLSDCTVADTLYIRGNAKVYLDKCNVDNVVVTGNGGISLLNGAHITNLELNTKATVNISKGAVVDTYTVNSSANSANVIGEGSVGKFIVKANGFKSDIMPEAYEIGKNITATFDGKEYTATASADTLFKVTPYVAIDSSYYYLECTPAQTGSLYFYYTDSSTAPTIAEFENAYTKAQYKKYVSVKADTEVSQKTFKANEVKDFDYVAIMFQAGTKKEMPIVISNSAFESTGFVNAPTLGSSNTVSFKASVGGTISYFYTDSTDVMTPAKFQKAYSSVESALKGTVSATANATGSVTLNSVYAASYDYVAFELRGTNGTTYAPVLLTIADTGFSTKPSVLTSGVITFVPKTSGSVYYYYSKTNTVPSASAFASEWTKAGTMASYKSVTANANSSITYNAGYTSAYPYLIVSMSDGKGSFKLPVCVELGYDSGFTAVPAMKDANTVKFVTSVGGTVQFYFTNLDSVPTTDQFTTLYNYARASGAAGYMNAWMPGYEGTISLTEDILKTYKYVVIMLTANAEAGQTTGVVYTPIVLELKYDPTSSLTGFVYTPYIENKVLYVKTPVDATVRYFYMNQSGALSSTDFYLGYANADIRAKGEVSTKANVVTAIPIDYSADVYIKYQTIVVAVYNGARYSEPVSLFAYADSPKPAGTAGFSYAASTEITNAVVVTPFYTGTLYYVATDSLVEANAEIDVLTAASKAVTAANRVAIEAGGKKYLAVQLVTSDNVYDKVVIDVATGSSHADTQYDDGAQTNETNLTLVDDGANKKFRYTVGKTADVSYTLVGDGQVIEYLGSKNKGNIGTVSDASPLMPQEFDYSAFYTFAQTQTDYAHVQIYVQCYIFDPTPGSAFSGYCASRIINLK